MLVALYLAWLFVPSLLLLWFVGLVTEDRTLDFRRSVTAIRPVWLSSFGLVIGASSR